MLDMLERERLDLVSGWKQDRKDPSVQDRCPRGCSTP